ncbi:hypothetical protein D3C71_1542080 [compost metagenome]
MNDQSVLLKIRREIMARSMLNRKLLPGLLSQPAGDFDSADIVGLPVMTASFRDKHLVAVPQPGDRLDSADQAGKVALIAGEQDRE